MASPFAIENFRRVIVTGRDVVFQDILKIGASFERIIS